MPAAGKSASSVRYCTRNRARPSRGQVRPVRQRPQPGRRAAARSGVSSPAGTRLAKVAIMQLTTAARDPMVERGEQQAPAATAGEAEGAEPAGSTPSVAASTSRATRSSASTAPAKVWPEGPGRLGQRVLVQPGQVIEPVLRGRHHALLRPQRVLRRRQRGQSGRRPATGRTDGCPRRTCRARGRRGRDGRARSPAPDPRTTRSRSGHGAQAGRRAQVDQLLGADRTHARRARAGRAPRAAAGDGGRPQQPGVRVRAVADRPAQPADVHAVALLDVLVDDLGPCRTGCAEPQHPGQRGGRVVGRDEGRRRPDRRRPVLVAGDRVWAASFRRSGGGGQRRCAQPGRDRSRAAAALDPRLQEDRGRSGGAAAAGRASAARRARRAPPPGPTPWSAAGSR